MYKIPGAWKYYAVGVSSIGISVEKFNKIDAMADVMLTCYAGEIAAAKGGMEIEQRNTRRNSSRNHKGRRNIDCNAKDSNGKDLVEFSDSEHGQNRIGR